MNTDNIQNEIDFMLQLMGAYEKINDKMEKFFENVDSEKIRCLNLKQRCLLLEDDISTRIDLLESDPALPYGLALASDNETDIKRYGRIVQKSKDPFYNTMFAINVVGADIKEHGRVVIKSGDPEANYQFAKRVLGSDIKKHESVVLDSKNPRVCFKFARDIEGSDILAHEKVVLESNSPVDSLNFVLRIKGSDVKAHEQVVLEGKNLRINTEFAKKVPEADIMAHGRVIIDSGDEHFIQQFRTMLKKRMINARNKQDFLAAERFANALTDFKNYLIEKPIVLKQTKKGE